MKFIKENLRNDEIKENCLFINLIFYKMFPNQIKIERKIAIDVPKFNSIGITIDFSINDLKKFLQYIFQDCEIIDTQGVGYGHPDFIIKKNDKKIYIEFKKNNDSLRVSQLNWFFKNKTEEIYILYFKDNEENYEKYEYEDIDYPEIIAEL